MQRESQPIVLEKSNSICLEKSLEKIVFSAKWNTEADMDIHALLLNQGKAKSDLDFIFFGHLEHATGCIKHSGDIRDGSVNDIGEAEEAITIDLTKLPSYVDEILLTANIYNAGASGLDFSDVAGSVCKITNLETGKDEVFINLDRDESLVGETCGKIARIYKQGNDWHVECVKKGVSSLAGILIGAGLSVK